MAKKRSGSPMPATACTRCPANDGERCAGARRCMRQRLVRQQPHRPFAEAGAGAAIAVATPPTLTTRKSQRGAAFRRFAQRAGRQQPAVAVAAAAVDHLDLDVARQAVMLQAVVADHDVAAGLGQRLRGGGTVAIDAHLRAGARAISTGSSPPSGRHRCRRSTQQRACARRHGRNRGWRRRDSSLRRAGAPPARWSAASCRCRRR